MENKHYPKCPYCGYEFDDEDMWYSGDTIGVVYTGDGMKSKLVCPYDDCKKEFTVTCNHLIEWIFESEEEDEQ